MGNRTLYDIRRLESNVKLRELLKLEKCIRSAEHAPCQRVWWPFQLQSFGYCIHAVRIAYNGTRLKVLCFCSDRRYEVPQS